MRNGPHPQSEPRASLIIRRTRESFQTTGSNVVKFAVAVAEQYLMTIPAADRTIEFYPAAGSLDSILKAQKNNGSTIDQIMRGTRKFPCDVEESWVAALPEPHRSNLVRELAARYGLTGMRAPMRTAHEHVATLADVMLDAGEIAKAMAPMLGDISSADSARLSASYAVVCRALDDVLGLREQLARQLGIVDGAASV